MPVNESAVLRRLLLKTPLYLILYSGMNGRTPVELSGGGYSAQRIAPDEWTIDGDKGEAPVKEFRFDGSRRLVPVGACLTDSNGDALAMMPFDEPIPVGRRGDVIPVRAIVRNKGAS